MAIPAKCLVMRGVIHPPMRLNSLLCLLLCLLTPLTLIAQERKNNAQMPSLPRHVATALERLPKMSAPEREKLHQQIVRAFGLKNLAQGRAAPKIEQTTVLWAVMDPKPAQIVQEDGTLIGDMTALGADGLQVFVKDLPNFTELRYRVECGGMPRMAGSVQVEHFEPTPESLAQADVPQGTLHTFEWTQSKVFPDTLRTVTVYLPPNHTPGEETCLMIWQDGTRHAERTGGMRVPVVFDNLIHQKAIPRMVGIFIDPGRRPKQKPGDKAANRSFEYDSLGDAYVRFLLTEIIPEVEKRHPVKFRPQPEAWGIAGGSSGGICAFTAAWERPDKFRKVLSWVGSFVDLRGGHAYPSMVRLAERKPLRIYLQDGTNDLDNPFGNWPLANKQMAAALKFMNYDFRIDWNAGFHGSKGMAPLLPEALRWLWRDVK
jgi:enterochelin esterase-like enzyme